MEDKIMANTTTTRGRFTLEEKIEKKSVLVIELEGKLKTAKSELTDLKKTKDERDLMEYIRSSKEDPSVLLGRLKGNK